MFGKNKPTMTTKWDAELAKKEFAIYFVKAAESKFLQKDATDHPSSSQPPFLWQAATYLANAATYLFSGMVLRLTTRNSTATALIEKIATSATQEYVRIRRENNKRKIDHTLLSSSQSMEEESSVEILEKFRQLFLQLALELFHAYEFQLALVARRVTLDTNGHDHFDRHQAIRILAEYGGYKCYAEFSNFSRHSLNQDLSTAILTTGKNRQLSIIQTLKSIYKDRTVDQLFLHLDDNPPSPSPVQKAGTQIVARTHTLQFFNLPVPAFYSKKESKLFVPHQHHHQSKEICWKFLRRPLKSEWSSFEESCGKNFQNFQNFEKVHHHEKTFFWTDQSKNAAKMYQNLVPFWQKTDEILCDMSRSKIPRLEAGLDKIFLEGQQNTFSIIEHVRDLKKNLVSKFPAAAANPKIGWTSSSSSIPPSRCLPPNPISSFVGREAIFDLIFKKFKNPATHPNDRILVLAGNGGMGKSEIGKKFVSHFWPGPKFWIDAETFDSLKNGLMGLAKNFGIMTEIGAKIGQNIGKSEVALVAQELYTFLATDIDQSALFIFDNAQQLNDQSLTSFSKEIFGILEFLPKTRQPKNHPAILITTRNRDWGSLANEKLEVILIPVLSEVESFEFFQKSLFPPHHDENNYFLKKIDRQIQLLNTTTLGGYPLALRLAASFIRRECAGCFSAQNFERAIKIYLSLDPSQLLTIKDEDRLSDYDLILGNVWERSRDRIQNFEPPANFLSSWPTMGDLKVGDMALKFLKMMAYLEPNFIFLEQFLIFYKYDLQKTKNFGAKNLQMDDEENFKMDTLKILGVLEKYSIIEIMKDDDDGGGFKIKIHPLIQLWMVHEEEEKGELLVQLVSAMNLSPAILEKFEDSIAKINSYLWKFGWPGGTASVSVKFCILTILRNPNPRTTQLLGDLYKFLAEDRKLATHSGDPLLITTVWILLIYEKYAAINKGGGLWSLPPEEMVVVTTTSDDDLLHRKKCARDVQEAILHFLINKNCTRILGMKEDEIFSAQFLADETIYQLKNFGMSGSKSHKKYFDEKILALLVDWVTVYRGMYRESLANWLFRTHGHLLEKNQLTKIWTCLLLDSLGGDHVTTTTTPSIKEYEDWEKMEMMITFSFIFNKIKNFELSSAVLDVVEKKLRLLFDDHHNKENGQWNAPLRYLTEKMYMVLTEGGPLWRKRLLQPQGLVTSFFEAMPSKIGTANNWDDIEYRELYALFATPRMCDFLMTLELLPEFDQLLNQDMNCKDSWNLLREAGMRLDNF